MEIDEKKLIEFHYLLDRLFENEATEGEVVQIQEIIQHCPRMQRYYFRCVELKAGLRQSNSLDSVCGNWEPNYENMFYELAEYEKTAPEIEISKDKPPRELIQKVVYPAREKRKMSTLSLVFLVMNAAAILFFVAYIKFAPPIPVEVATLSDSMNATWADMDASMQNGTRLVAAGNDLVLSEGIAALTFDNHTQAIVEAPAEFQILADDHIFLRYGKIYVTVPQEAIGFKVHSPFAQIIDLGTEFGIEADMSGNTYLHMTKGKTMLIAGEKRNQISMDVSAGAAKKVCAVTKTVTDTPYQETTFARAIDSSQNIVWRGQAFLDLADIVRSGNGLGTGNSDVRLNPAEGFTNKQNIGTVAFASEYRRIKDHPFIDGIFIPDGNTMVSSRGNVFKDCPATGGVYRFDLLANPSPGILHLDRSDRVHFEGQEYSDRGKPCIMMYGNRGITFDLEAIRSSYQSRIGHFTGRIGIANYGDNPSNADFYVLVDGRPRYSLLQYTEKGVLKDFSVAIEDGDRFLTLMTIDDRVGGQPDQPVSESIFTSDWGVFAEPRLTLE